MTIQAPETLLHVEILDRRGRLAHRERIGRLPCLIGRAYACDIVLDDRFVSPRHARIDVDADGRIVAHDLDSTNGTYDQSTNRSVQSVVVGNGATLRLGQTLLRFHRPDEDVPEAVSLSTVSTVPVWSAIVAFASAVAISLGSQYLETFERFSASSFLVTGAFLVIAMCLWAGMWALLSRLLLHQSHLRDHYFVISVWILVTTPIYWLLSYYAFAFDAELSASILEWTVVAAMIGVLLYGHLRFCSILPPPALLARTSAVLGVAAVLIGTIMLADRLDPDWTAAISFRSDLKPPSFRAVSGQDMEEFFGRLEELRVRVDALAEDR